MLEYEFELISSIILFYNFVFSKFMLAYIDALKKRHSLNECVVFGKMEFIQ